MDVEDCTGGFDLRPTGNGKTGWLTGGFADEYGRVYGVFLTADELRELAKVALHIISFDDEVTVVTR